MADAKHKTPSSPGAKDQTEPAHKSGLAGSPPKSDQQTKIKSASKTDPRNTSGEKA